MEKNDKILIKSEAVVAVEKINRAVISSICLITINLLVAVYGVLTSSTSNTDNLYVGITLLLYIGLTYLLAYSRSRTAAWILLIYFCLEVLIALSTNSSGLGIITILFIIGFIIGVQGTHQYQKNKPSTSIPVDHWIPPILGTLAGVSILLIFILISAINSNKITSTATIQETQSSSEVSRDKQGSSARDIYEKLSPAVVTLYFEDAKSGAQGSGVIIHENGLVVTNHHVLEGITSTSRDYARDTDGSEHPISGLLITDEKFDLGLISITGKNHPTISIADSDNVSIGEKVYTIGSPQGFESTISEGIISSVRYIDGVKIFQITNPISQGSSGGALLNESGDLIGITQSIWSDGQNINFAIPSNYIEELAQRYIDQNPESLDQ
jgi:uncharacterized membrane protein